MIIIDTWKESTGACILLNEALLEKHYIRDKKADTLNTLMRKY